MVTPNQAIVNVKLAEKLHEALLHMPPDSQYFDRCGVCSSFWRSVDDGVRIISDEGPRAGVTLECTTCKSKAMATYWYALNLRGVYVDVRIKEFNKWKSRET